MLEDLKNFKMAIYFLKDSTIKENEILIGKDLLHHLRNVLRIRKGDVVKFFDEERIFVAECIQTEKNSLTFKVNEVFENKTPEIEFQIVQSFIEKSELEDTIRFLVSAKVKRILLVKTKRSPFELKESQLKRLKEIALNTAEQSEVCFVPEISVCENLEKAIDSFHENAFVLHFGSSLSLKDIAKFVDLKKPITFFVGPEGGFAENEITHFKDRNIKIITLKSGVFRSQFAGTVAVLTTLELISLQD